jgi:uncharacterized membrane-anchored protein YitT (DUF2179 family)
LNGLGWSGRFSWSILYTALFVVAITYAVAFVLFKTKFAWLVAGILAGVVQILLYVPAMIQNGPNWASLPVMLFEWFVVGTVASLVALQVPTERPPSAKKGTPYY